MDRTHRHTLAALVSGRVCTKRPSRRQLFRDYSLALYSMARWLPLIRHCLRTVKGSTPDQAAEAVLCASGHPFECWHYRGCYMCGDLFSGDARRPPANHHDRSSEFLRSVVFRCGHHSSADRACDRVTLEPAEVIARSMADGSHAR